MLVRRLLLLLAVLIVLTAVAGSIVPVPGPPEEATPTPTPAAIPRAPQASPAAEPDHPDVRASLSSSPRTAARRIVARVGDQVAITVRAGAIDTVQLGDLDVQPVEPGIPAQFDLLADEAGSYALVLLQAGRRIGTLVVR